MRRPECRKPKEEDDSSVDSTSCNDDVTEQLLCDVILFISLLTERKAERENNEAGSVTVNILAMPLFTSNPFDVDVGKLGVVMLTIITC